MRRSILFISLVFLAFGIAAQPPQLIPYQAIARDNAGNPVLNQNIGLRFSIHDQTIGGTVVWQESQTVVSNNLGIIVTALGGTVQLTSVDWGSGGKFLQVEMDITGGSNYLDMGTQQMMSVPYALYAETSGSVINNGGGGNVSFTHWIGEYYQGGVICHLWKDNQGVEHGLIVSITNVGYFDQNFLGGYPTAAAQTLGLSTSNFDGFFNTQYWTGNGYDACINYEHDMFDDWYFPAFFEMECLIRNKLPVDISLSTISGAETIFSGSWDAGFHKKYWASGNSGIDMFCDLVGPISGANWYAYVRAFRKF